MLDNTMNQDTKSLLVLGCFPSRTSGARGQKTAEQKGVNRTKSSFTKVQQTISFLLQPSHSQLEERS